jgi:predicted dehydrogenase
VRIVLAGAGTAAARGHLPAIERFGREGELALAGVAEPDSRRRADAAVGLSAAPLFESAEEMLDRVDADVLVVAAEPGAHADLVVLGLERGLDVVCEKPLALGMADYRRIAAHVDRAGPALISVHQYRYSPPWRAMARWARLAARLSLPFSLAIDVQRREVDALAASPWRSQAQISGGILADHGVHYLALAWTVDRDLEVLSGSRVSGGGAETATAFVRLGSGTLVFEASTGKPKRRTGVSLRMGDLVMRWQDRSFGIAVRNRLLFSKIVPTLADRTYVDLLYGCLYRDLAGNLSRPAWRAVRSAEALSVGEALLDLLALSPLSSRAEAPAPPCGQSPPTGAPVSRVGRRTR